MKVIQILYQTVPMLLTEREKTDEIAILVGHIGIEILLSDKDKQKTILIKDNRHY